MALSLGITVGQRIAVGRSIVQVTAIKNPELMLVSLDGGPTIAVHSNKAQAVTILPEVRLFVGLGKKGKSHRLAFEAPKSIPIHLLAKEEGNPELQAAVQKGAKTMNANLSKALFLNGVYEKNLDTILDNQKTDPAEHHYLQPYSENRIVFLAESAPTPKNPITIYLSLTESLSLVSHRAKVVGWQDKRKLETAEIDSLNQHIQKSRPSEEEIYLKNDHGKLCVNLISISHLEQMDYPFATSLLIKTSDGKPLKKRNRPGGWSVVREVSDGLGTMPIEMMEQVETELQANVARSSDDDAALRQQRLASAPKLPESILVVSRAYRRNPDVIVEVLRRANGKCEDCHKPAPFTRQRDGSPFLEVHHLVMLSLGGEDTVENAVALCPNCHRKRHFG
jgi:hypothetical protein